MIISPYWIPGVQQLLKNERKITAYYRKATSLFIATYTKMLSEQTL